jgi:WD40 repeat protein
LDFSTDNFYLLCEDNVGEVTLYEIETDRPIQSEAIDFELEWLGEGLRTYSKLKGVRHQFSTNNDIAQIRKVLGKPIVIVCDEIGTVRLFNYPNVKGDAYYNYYPEHLYQVTECLISPDRNFFVSTCDVDKCIFQWELRYNESKVQKMIENMQNQDK